jgi:hypothetical protein
VLTMLDKAGGGAGAGSDAGYENGSSDFGSTGPSAPREKKPAMAGGGSVKRDDMDDEIPF